jgi:hypothetical protein
MHKWGNQGTERLSSPLLSLYVPSKKKKKKKQKS